jgi:hypothetical protein
MEFRCPGCSYVDASSSKLRRHLTGIRNKCATIALVNPQWKCPYKNGIAIVANGDGAEFERLIISHLESESNYSLTMGGKLTNERTCCGRSIAAEEDVSNRESGPAGVVSYTIEENSEVYCSSSAVVNVNFHTYSTDDNFKGGETNYESENGSDANTSCYEDREKDIYLLLNDEDDGNEDGEGERDANGADEYASMMEDDCGDKMNTSSGGLIDCDIIINSHEEFQRLVSSKNRFGYTLEKQLELFAYCVEDYVTRKSYDKLLKLFAFDAFRDELPNKFQTLEKIIRAKLHKWFGGEDHIFKIDDLKIKYKDPKTIHIPFQSLTQVLKNMLTSNSLKEDIRKHNGEYIPQTGDISVVGGALEAALADRKMKQSLHHPEEYTYKEIGDGSEYLSNIIDTRHLWKENYLKAKGKQFVLM